MCLHVALESLTKCQWIDSLTIDWPCVPVIGRTRHTAPQTKPPETKGIELVTRLMFWLSVSPYGIQWAKSLLLGVFWVFLCGEERKANSLSLRLWNGGTFFLATQWRSLFTEARGAPSRRSHVLRQKIPANEESSGFERFWWKQKKHHTTETELHRQTRTPPCCAAWQTPATRAHLLLYCTYAQTLFDFDWEPLPLAEPSDYLIKQMERL